ncbi:MAG: DUF1700 domain-containing protein [Defluviitaleaceae bacterium]|nr:DUF1700 domain-containing protein [Defluviitaleaceae bacterium]
MTKVEFMKQLNNRLQILPESERRDALEYYEGYISDADSEEAALAQLGTPAEVAAKIIANATFPAEASPPPPPPAGISGVKTAWLVILAIFAVPIGFPVIITLASVAFALFIVLIVLIFTFFILGVSLLFAGIVSIFSFPFIMFQDFGASLLALGGGLVTIGVCIFVFNLMAWILRGFPVIPRYVSKKISDKKGGANDGKN